MLMGPEEDEDPDYWLTYPYVVDLTVLESPEEVITEGRCSIKITRGGGDGAWGGGRGVKYFRCSKYFMMA